MGFLEFLGFGPRLTHFQEQQVENCRRILADSLEIMRNTADIDTFLSRYCVAEEAIYEAGRIAGEYTPCLNDVTPAEALDALHMDISSALIPCIDRYMDKQTVRICNLTRGRISKARALDVIAENYQDRIPVDCLDHWKFRIFKLVQRLERLERLEAAEKADKLAER